MLCVIATEAILFAYLIFSYAYLGTQARQWPSGGVPSLRLALPATVLLVASSVVREWSTRAARREKMGRARLAVAMALLMGLGFAALELEEWKNTPFTLSTDSYSAIYFLLTGTHLFHVGAGLLGMALLLAWSLSGRLAQGHDQHRTLVTVYWHFVDIVWLFVFATIYLSPRLA